MSAPDYPPHWLEGEPFARHDWHDILVTARAGYQTRELKYPLRVDQGLLSRAEADADLAAWAAIIADWHWIITGEGAPAMPDTLEARIKALDASLETIADLMREGVALSKQVNDQALRIIAMRWHIDPARTRPTIHDIARLNHALRANAEAETQPERKAA